MEEEYTVVACHNLPFVGHGLGEGDGYFDYELHIHLLHLLEDT
jgi:hypothetical protein